MSKLRHIAFTLLLLIIAALFIPVFAEPLSDAIPDVGVLYTIHKPTVSTENLLQATFSEEELSHIVSDDRGLDRQMWEIENSDSIPFCSIGPIYPAAVGIQDNILIYRIGDETDEYSYYYHLDSWNTIPDESGFKAERASETIEQGLDLLEKLGLNHAEPVYFRTLGRMHNTVPCRKVTYRETINDLPLYWSAECLSHDDFVEMAAGCYAEVIYSDLDGLLVMEADWCDFSPAQTSEKASISQQAAAARFSENGNKTSIPELCYFMDIQDGQGTAVLAWRAKTSFISAVTGEWLQIDQ